MADSATAKAGFPDKSIIVPPRCIWYIRYAVDVSMGRLRKYFVASDMNHYQVSKHLRDSIVFSTQNVISDAPFTKLDLISCRNLMIYLEPETQQKSISLFHYALIENGHLLLGPAETTWRAANLFVPVSKKWRIYRRVGPGGHGATSVTVDKSELRPRGQKSDTPLLSPGSSNSNPAYQFDIAGFERLNSIADLLSKRLVETNQHVRDLAHGIMPIQIDAEGLRSALVELTKSISSNEKVHCDFECEGKVRILNNTTATHLYRIAKHILMSEGIDGLMQLPGIGTSLRESAFGTP